MLATIAAALAAIAINIYFWVGLYGLESIRRLAAEKDVLFCKDVTTCLLCFIAICGAVGVSARLRRERSLRYAEEQKIRDRQSETAQLSDERDGLAKKLAEAESERARLRTAFDDSSKRISELEARSSGPRSEAIDAELVNLLSLFQDKGRFIDFLMQDISRYPDPQVAAGARVVHQGCAAVLREYFSVEPLHTGSEGEAITVDSSAPAGQYRLIGNVGAAGPLKGIVLHRGWKTDSVKLPRVVDDIAGPARVIAPAQIEIR